MSIPKYDSILKDYIYGLLEEKRAHGVRSEPLYNNLAEID